MKNEKLEEIIKRENLGPVCYDETDFIEDTIYFVEKDNCWNVYTTDERAVPLGKVRKFENEDEAIEHVLKRLRASL